MDHAPWQHGMCGMPWPGGMAGMSLPSQALPCCDPNSQNRHAMPRLHVLAVCVAMPAKCAVAQPKHLATPCPCSDQTFPSGCSLDHLCLPGLLPHGRHGGGGGGGTDRRPSPATQWRGEHYCQAAGGSASHHLPDYHPHHDPSSIPKLECLPVGSQSEHGMALCNMGVAWQARPWLVMA